MKITDHIKKAKNTLFSFEILPPLKGQDISELYRTIDPLMEFKPAFIDVTYHREEFIYKKHPNGLLEKHSVRKRPGTVGICAAIMNKYNVDAVPHIICGGFTKEETENALIDLNFLGIDNVLLLRGDPVKSERNFIPEPNGHAYASDLVDQVVALNRGKYLHEEVENAFPTDFCIGVAGYPEKHFEAPNLKSDLKNLKQKVDMGADYIVTQMFFDNKRFFEFVKLCREAGIEVPIIPGIKPLTGRKQLTLLSRTFYVTVPEELSDEVEQCKSDEAVRQLGIEWAVNQSKELIKAGVPCLHYYPMGKAEAVKKIADQIF